MFLSHHLLWIISLSISTHAHTLHPHFIFLDPYSPLSLLFSAFSYRIFGSYCLVFSQVALYVCPGGGLSNSRKIHLEQRARVKGARYPHAHKTLRGHVIHVRGMQTCLPFPISLSDYSISADNFSFGLALRPSIRMCAFMFVFQDHSNPIGANQRDEREGR